MKLLHLFLAYTFSLFCMQATAQSVAINNTNTQAHVSAVLDVQSVNKGFLPPRMSWAQAKTIPQPAAGLIIFDTDISRLRMFTGIKWIVLGEMPKDMNASPGAFNVDANIGGTGYIFPARIRQDATGNSIIAGYYTGTLQLGHYSYTATGKDIFFAKFDKSGNLLWLKPMGSAEDDAASDMDIDASGNIYIGGYFGDIMDFDPDAAGQYQLGTNTTIGFLSKYNSNGEFIWARGVGTNSTASVKAIDVDEASGRLYYTGSFSGSGDFNWDGAITTTLTSAGNLDTFFGSCLLNATLVYVKRIGNANHNIPGDICFLGNDIFITGSFQLTMDFNPDAGVYNMTVAGYENAFLAKYNAADGTFIWAKMMTSNNACGFGKIAVTSNNMLAVGGYFDESVDLDMNAGIAFASAYGTYADAFIAVYHPATCTYMGGKVFQGTSFKGVSDIATDNQGNIYATLSYDDTLFAGTINDPNAFAKSPGPSSDVMICKINSSLKGVWIETFSGSMNESGSTIALAPDHKSFSVAMSSASPALKYPGGQLAIPSAGLVLANYFE